MLVQKSLKLFLVILFLVIPCLGSDICSERDPHKWKLAKGEDVPQAERTVWFALAEVQDGTFADKCLGLLSHYPQLLDSPDPDRGDRHLIHLCIDNHNIDGVKTLLGHGVSPHTRITSTSRGARSHATYGLSEGPIPANLLDYAIDKYLSGDTAAREALQGIVRALFDHGGSVYSGWAAKKISKFDDWLWRMCLERIDANRPDDFFEKMCFLVECLKSRDVLSLNDRIKNLFKRPNIASYILPDVVLHKNDDATFVQEVLGAAGDVNAIGVFGNTALREACAHDNIDLFRQLIGKGARLFINNDWPYENDILHDILAKERTPENDILDVVLAEERDPEFAQYFLDVFDAAIKELEDARDQDNKRGFLVAFLKRASKRNNWESGGAKLALAKRLFMTPLCQQVLGEIRTRESPLKTGKKAFAYTCCINSSEQGLELLSLLGERFTAQDQDLLACCINPPLRSTARALGSDRFIPLLLDLGCKMHPTTSVLMEAIVCRVSDMREGPVESLKTLKTFIGYGFNINAPDCHGELFGIYLLDKVCTYSISSLKTGVVVRFIDNLIREGIIDPFARSSSSRSILLCAMKKYEQALLDFDQIRDVINACKTFAQTSEVNRTAMNAQMQQAFYGHFQKMLAAAPEQFSPGTRLPLEFNSLHRSFVRLFEENVWPVNGEYPQTVPEIMRLKNRNPCFWGWVTACARVNRARGLQAPPGTVVGAQAAAPVLVPQLAPSSAQVSQPAAETDSEGAVAASRQLVGAALSSAPASEDASVLTVDSVPVLVLQLAPSSAPASEEVAVLTEESVPAKPKQKWNMHAKKIAGGGTVLALGSLAYLVAELSKNRENRALVRWFFKKLRGKKVAPLTSQQRKSAGRLKIDAAVAIPGVVLGAAAVVAARNIKTP